MRQPWYYGISSRGDGKAIMIRDGEDSFKTVGTPTLQKNVKISCRNVNVFYGTKQAIKDLTVDIADREVTAFNTWAMPHVTAVVVFTGVPCSLFRFDLVESATHLVAPLDAIENKEFVFRTKISGIANSS